MKFSQRYCAIRLSYARFTFICHWHRIQFNFIFDCWALEIKTVCAKPNLIGNRILLKSEIKKKLNKPTGYHFLFFCEKRYQLKVDEIWKLLTEEFLKFYNHPIKNKCERVASKRRQNQFKFNFTFIKLVGLKWTNVSNFTGILGPNRWKSNTMKHKRTHIFSFKYYNYWN